MKATIIIPTCNRTGPLIAALESISSIDPGALGIEVLVVDNNQAADARRQVKSICSQIPGSIRYAAEPSPGLSAARHRGAFEATGDILIYVDDDVLVSRSWAEAILDAFTDPGAGIVGGPSIPVFTGSIPSWFWGFVDPTPFGGWSCGSLSLLDIGSDTADINPIWIWGLNFSIRKSILFELGGFNPDIVPARYQRWQGDGETGLAYKALEAGVRTDYRQAALLRHVIGADRLIPAYFEKRAYFQGVCDSFSRIRAGTEPQADTDGPKQIPVNPETGWGAVAYPARLSAFHAHNRGWRYHQTEVAHDPELLSWVRRKDFLYADVRTPAGRDPQ